VAAARHHGFAYAQARSLGSIGFLAASLAMGVLIAHFGVNAALWWIALWLVAVAALAARHPGGHREQGQIPPTLREIARLVANPVFAHFMAAAAFTQASQAVMFALGSIHWRTLGLGDGQIGTLWATSIAAEIVFMLAFGAWATRRLGAVGAMALGGAAGVVRWSVMMFVPTGWLLWPLQSLHALTFALGHLGGIAFIMQAIPARFGAAAQGAATAMATGLALAFGISLAATLYPALGGRTYGIGVVFVALGVALCGLLARRWRGGELAI
jgi:PPP family 3-phenylpropionic acid transporter